MKFFVTILSMMGGIASSLTLFGQAGTLDSTFHADGAAFFYFQGGRAVASAINVLPNEKILVAGTVVTGPGADTDMLLLRYNPDGSLDASFGQGGFVLYDSSHQNDVAKAMAVQPDGKILVAGWTAAEGENYGLLCRFLPDGDLDKDFGNNGVVLNENELVESPSTQVFLDSGGRILWCLVTREHDSSIMRYLPNGAIDISYGKEGEAFFRIPGIVYENGNWELLPDGKMVVVLVYQFFNDKLSADIIFPFSFLRYDENGKNREVFSTGISDGGYIYNIVNWGNGIAIGGKTISKITYDGDIDGDFALNGNQKAVPGITQALALQLDNKLIAAGHDADTLNKRIVVARMLPDGELDKHFNGNGKAILNFSPKDDIAYATAIDADDRILVAGQSGDSLLVARLFGSKYTGPPSAGVDSIYFGFRPNPVDDILIADYALPMDGVITIELLDLYGRLVQAFYNNATRQAGHYIEPLRMANGLANGTYILRFRADGYSGLKKLILAR